MDNSKELAFYTTGEMISNKVWELFNEGTYYNAIEALREGGLTDNLIRLFFLGAITLVGDTRDEDGIYVEDTKAFSKKKFGKILEKSIYLFTKRKLSFDPEDIISNGEGYKYRDDRLNQHLESLFKIFPLALIKDTIAVHRIKRKGYKIVKKIEDINFSGVICQNGTIIQCGYQGHNELFRLLYQYDYVTAGCWTECNESIHISSGQMSGSLAYNICDYNDWGDDRNDLVTDKLLKIIFENREYLEFYGSGRKGNIGYRISQFNEGKLNMGGKFGKLSFLKKFYPDLNLPKFDTKKIKGVKNCIRTSPLLSIPGLLNSKFDINENSIKELEEDFEKYKNVVGMVKYIGRDEPTSTNELRYFYQEYLEGVNGVAHFRNGEDFTYDCSENRGDIVDGKTGNITLHIAIESELKSIVQRISEDTGRDIQVEFVVVDEKIYIVQLRYLSKDNISRNFTVNPDEAIVSGKSFSFYTEKDLTKDDVLIIDEDCESEMVIGKKGLIVRNVTEFSHALALSAALKIPSIYGVGNDFELPSKFEMDCSGRDGYIFKQD